MLTPELAGKTSRMNAAFPMVDLLLKKLLLQSHLILNLPVMKRKRLAWGKTLLKKVKEYIDDNLNPAKLNVIDPTKDNFTQPSSIQEILDELEISKNNYCKSLSVSKDNDLELHLKKQPNSCFVYNYFGVGLKAWQANMDIQLVFNEYKVVTYMCQYFSKTEDQFELFIVSCCFISIYPLFF